MGGGDIKMMAMVGAFLGWQGVLLTIFLGPCWAAWSSCRCCLAGRKKLVPFGIFLAIGAAITYAAGPAIFALVRRIPGRRMSARPFPPRFASRSGWRY